MNAPYHQCAVPLNTAAWDSKVARNELQSSLDRDRHPPGGTTQNCTQPPAIVSAAKSRG